VAAVKASKVVQDKRMAQGLLKLKHARETKAINVAHAKRMADGVAKLKIRLAAEKKSVL
jgi:hypothetical protein